MKRETLKTLAGLAIITLIVVATFLYGNSQRQAQQKQDQAKKQQAATPSPSTSAKASPKATPTPSPVPSGSVAQGPVDGGSGSGATPKPTAAPVTGGTTTIPDTGSETAPLLGVAVLGLTYVFYRRSGRRIEAAIRTRR